MSVPAKLTLRSGDLARLAGVSPDTLRFYERKGLFMRPPRAANGYRCYSPAVVDRLRLIRAALAIGFSTDELAEIFATRDRGGAPCLRVRELAGKKLQALESQIRELARLRRQLREVLQGWDLALKKTPPATRAGLLEALALRPAARTIRRNATASRLRRRSKLHES